MMFRYRHALNIAATALVLTTTASIIFLTPEGTAVVWAQEANRDRATEANELHQEGDRLFQLGQERKKIEPYQEVITYFQDALAIYEEIRYLQGVGNALDQIGWIYTHSGQYELALTYFFEALEIRQEIRNHEKEGDTLWAIGWAYTEWGQYEQAHNYCFKALEIYQRIENLLGESSALVCIGWLFSSLGQYEQSLHYYEKSLSIIQEIGDQGSEGNILNNIGLAYLDLEQYEQALHYFRQTLIIDREIENPIAEAITLHNIGLVYLSLKQYEQAIHHFQESLTITKKIGHRATAGDSLNSLGNLYRALGQYEQALWYYQQSLSISQIIEDRHGQADTFYKIGRLFEAQEQSQLAILFLKQSVNIFEQIRDGLQPLTQELQQSYTDKVSGSYRLLANLLLQQDRVLEAQRVLDLLKVQELDNYLRGVRGNAVTANGVQFWQPEQEILERFNFHQQRAIELGQELTELRQIPEGDRTPTQNQRIDELVQLEQDLNQQFNDFIDSDEIIALVSQLSITTQRQTLNLEDVNGLRDDLAQLNAVLLYPLILDDRLELVITTPNSPPLRRTVDVSREELNRAILEFRQLLQTPRRNATVPAQKLYRWLIEPLEHDLVAADIDTIIYAPDGQLRYIPLAALHDGDRYLIEKYAVNNITARSLTNLDTQPADNPSVLAGAFADEEQVYPIQLGQRSINFRGLPFAGEEVKTLTDRLANITSFVDNEFSLEAVRSRLNEHDIIHFATHAAFVPGIPEDSFILFGNGDKSTLADVRDWSLQNVDLVVLSACQTGLGGFGNGEEILGLGYQFQRAGARAAIASLWQVSDRGTQVLMEAFYTALQNGYSKTDALRRAQQSLIIGNKTVLAGQEDTTIEVMDTLTGTPLTLNTDLSHPYYWAPFILIGNGL